MPAGYDTKAGGISSVYLSASVPPSSSSSHTPSSSGHVEVRANFTRDVEGERV